jgi:uncharacterized protein Yka (UPF0111/DUF47 family)
LRRHEYTDIVKGSRELRLIEKEADAVYREAISALFREGTSGKAPFHDVAPGDARILVREKIVLDDLENAIDACDSIADTLANLAIKHG